MSTTAHSILSTGATAPVRTHSSSKTDKTFSMAQYCNIKLFHLRVWVIQRQTWLFYLGALLLAFVFLHRGIMKHFRHPWSNDNHQHNDLTYDTWQNNNTSNNYPD